MTRTDAADILRNSIPRDCRLGRVCRDYYPEDQVTYWSAEIFPCDGADPLGTVEFMEDGDDPVIHWG